MVTPVIEFGGLCVAVPSHALVLHFDVSSFGGTVRETSLNIPIRNIDPADALLGVYYFAGDGEVSTDEWGIGSMLPIIDGIGFEFSMATIDVTEPLRESLDSGSTFLSFNLRAHNRSRMDISLDGRQAFPFLYVVPEMNPLVGVFPLLVGLGRVRRKSRNSV